MTVLLSLRELETLKQFINITAEKEIVGRQKLEEFISELIDRADRAERELNLSRTQVKASHQTQDLPQKVNQDTSYVQCLLLIQIQLLCCEICFFVFVFEGS